MCIFLVLLLVFQQCFYNGFIVDFVAETEAFSSPYPISLVADSDWSSDWQSFNLVVDQTGLELPSLQRPSLPETHRQVDTEAYNA